MNRACIRSAFGLLGFSVLAALIVPGQAQNVGIGTSSPHPSARLDVFSTSSGILIPRMSTVERDAIPTPANSVIIYNTTTRCFETYNQILNRWESIHCMCSQLPAPPTPLPANNVTSTSFKANWTGSPSAISYFLDVATDPGFSSILPGYNNLDVGNANSYTVTWISYNATYYYRVRVKTICGLSTSSDSVIVTTRSCPKCIAIGTFDDENGSALTSRPGGFVAAGISSWGRVVVVNIDHSGNNIVWNRSLGFPFLLSGAFSPDITISESQDSYYVIANSGLGRGYLV